MAWAFSILGAAACGAASPGPAAPGGATTSGDQVSQGAKLYADACAGCHESGGEGNAKAPAVVGKTALPLDPQPPSHARKAQFHTAGDVLRFIKANMPPKNPGSLGDAEYAAILAFDLKANGVDLTGKQVDASTADTFVLHP